MIDLAGWQKQLEAKDAELVALRKDHVGQELFEFLTPYAVKGVIVRDSKHERQRKDYAEILELAGFNRSLCKRVLDMRVANMPPQGRTARDEHGNIVSTLPPAGAQVQRSQTILAARQELEENPALQRLTNKTAYVNQALREAGLPKLSDAELKAFQE